jgi:hypothetical protein
MRLDPLCEFELRYTSEFVLVQPYGTEEGSGYGEGDGTVLGERLNGTVRWVNHPRRRSDTAMLPDAHGVITTEDGATVLFSLGGRTVWSEDGSRGGQSLCVLFEAEHERYRWLNGQLCVLEGVIDPERLVMRARAYVCVNELLREPG